MPEREIRVQGARLLALGSYRGSDGGNAFLDFGDLPFTPRRLYTVHDVGPGITRGNHAHRIYAQLLIASAGSCRIHLSDTIHADEILLSKPHEALLVGPRIWTVAADFAPGTALTVLSSGPYDKAEFIESLEELAAMNAGSE